MHKAENMSEDDHSGGEPDLSQLLPHGGHPRGTVLAPEQRLERLRAALPVVRSVTEGETDEVALQATLACLLFETLLQTNWCGFYRRVGEATLKVGPYQGSLGCLAIPFARGVCGRAARTGKRVLVPNVLEFEDHIACSSATRSELVIPVFNSAGRLIAVLDLDSTALEGFSADEADLLESLLKETFARLT